VRVSEGVFALGREHNVMTVTGRWQKRDVAELMGIVLARDALVRKESQIEQKALFVFEVINAVFGNPDPELMPELKADLAMLLSPEGYVQRYLDGTNLVLCTRRIVRLYQNGHGPYPVAGFARYAAESDDLVIDDYVLREDEAVFRAVTRRNRRTALAVVRRPGTLERADEATKKLRRRIARELKDGSQ
jgi:hypothetical protein